MPKIGGHDCLATVAALSVLVTLGATEPSLASAPPTPPTTPPTASACVAAAVSPDYYAIDLVTTRKIPGTGLARGKAEVTFATSPFGVALAPDGSYLYDVHVQLDRMKPLRSGTLVAWATTTRLDQTRKLGVLDENFRVSGRVSWNKFILVISLEDGDAPDAARWSGPVAFRGLSRSGRMHTMAGHGPFQQENCASFGFD